MDREAHGQIESVSIGVKGNCKLGYWVPAQIKFKGDLPDQLVVECTLPDTDGIKATFVDEKPIVRDVGEYKLVETLVKLGRSKGAVDIQLTKKSSNEEDSEPVAKGQFRISSICTPLDSLVELYVSLGRSIEIKGAASIGGNNEYAPASTVAIDLKEILEDGALGTQGRSFDSIDAIILEAGSFVETPLPYSTQTAIASWLRNGGKLAISGGQRLQEFFEKNPELATIFQGEILGSRRLNSTSSLERIVKAGDSVSGPRNRPYVAVIRNIDGEVFIREGADAVVIRHSVGFGQFVLVTVNLAEPPISDWADRKSLGGMIIGLLNFNAENRRNQEQRTNRFGFQDLSGQLRAALDDFSDVATVNFTVVAAIAILFIGLIGPIDYFLLKRFAKRMEWTWVSFSLIVVLISCLTFVIHNLTKSNKLLVRQVEIVDIDSSTGVARGSLWCHVYSPTSQKYDIRWNQGSNLMQSLQYGSWFGFPSDALGGMENNSVNTSSSAEYQVMVHQSKLAELPINVAATRGLQMDWVGQAKLGSSGSPRIVRNTLRGRVSNPLDVELENVLVIHKRSVYQYKGKLGPGDSFDLEQDAKERNFADYLNLRKVKDLGTEATPWTISDTNLRRILEIMMFYESAGGRGYVNLFQRYFHHIDFSFSAGDDRAILVGRTRTPANRMEIDGDQVDEAYEESWTCYRILLPVQQDKNTNR